MTNLKYDFSEVQKHMQTLQDLRTASYSDTTSLEEVKSQIRDVHSGLWQEEDKVNEYRSAVNEKNVEELTDHEKIFLTKCTYEIAKIREARKELENMYRDLDKSPLTHISPIRDEYLIHSDYVDAEKNANESYVQIEAALDKEADRLMFEGAKIEYDLLKQFLDTSEKKFQLAMDNLYGVPAGPVRDSAIQSLLGAKETVDLISKQMNDLECRYPDLLNQKSEQAVAVEEFVSRIQEKMGKIPESIESVREAAKTKVTDTVENWKSTISNAIHDTDQYFKQMKSDLVSKAVAAVSMINSHLDKANQDFKEKGAIAYVGLGVKARDLTVVFTEKSIKGEKECIRKTKERLDKVNEIIDKANQVKTAGHQLKNAWRNLFGMKEQSGSKDIPKENIITEKLRTKLENSKHNLSVLEEQLPEMKAQAEQARLYLVELSARTHKETEQLQNLKENAEEIGGFTEEQLTQLYDYAEIIHEDDIALMNSINEILNDQGIYCSLPGMKLTFEERVQMAEHAGFEEKEAAGDIDERDLGDER